MDSKEIYLQLNMSYKNLVDYLLKKYGSCQYDYFCNETCRSINKKAKRTDEGLFLHHIDEDKAIMLSTSKFAQIQPYSYQKADRLVYCNILEHLILHIRITIESRHPDAVSTQRPGIGGVINMISRQINDYYNGFNYKYDYMIKTCGFIKNNFEDYISI